MRSLLLSAVSVVNYIASHLYCFVTVELPQETKMKIFLALGNYFKQKITKKQLLLQKKWKKTSI